MGIGNLDQLSTGSLAPAKFKPPTRPPPPASAEVCTKSARVFPKMHIIVLENEGFWAMKVTIFQIFRLWWAILVKKCVSGLIMNTNLKNVHHQQDFNFFLIFK